MKHIKIIGLLIATTAVSAFADELYRATVQSSKENPQLVIIKSGNEVVAEVKVKTGTLSVGATNITYHEGRDGRIYNCNGASRVELSVEGKSLLTASGDLIVIQPLNSTSPGKKSK
jgi:hypothetical protein